VTVGTVGAAAGLWTGRADVALAGAALLVSVALGLSGRLPARRPVVTAHAPAVVAAGAPVEVRVAVDAPPGVSAVVVRLPAGSTVPHGEDLLGLGREREHVRRHVTDGWGAVRLARPDWLAVAADGLVVSGPVQASVTVVTVVPTPVPGASVPAPPRARGGRGAHAVRTGAAGSQITGVRPYQAGDLLRRIDWRVTGRALASRHPALRSSALHVRTTAAETDADVVLFVDTRLDIAPTMGAWDLDLGRSGRAAGRRRRGTDRTGGEPLLRPPAGAPGGSLEGTVDAAVTLAAEHLRAGDRVAVVDLGRPRAGVPAGTGRRHLDRIRYRLARVSVDKTAVWRPGTLAPAVEGIARRLPTGAATVVASAFYDAEITDVTRALARSGRPVLALDTAPATVAADPRVPRSAEALRLVALERDARLDGLRAAGVTVRRWSRATPTPRVGRRT
jgi:uncharacterized protein (DUF58 family)